METVGDGSHTGTGGDSQKVGWGRNTNSGPHRPPHCHKLCRARTSSSCRDWYEYRRSSGSSERVLYNNPLHRSSIRLPALRDKEEYLWLLSLVHSLVDSPELLMFLEQWMQLDKLFLFKLFVLHIFILAVFCCRFCGKKAVRSRPHQGYRS